MKYYFFLKRVPFDEVTIDDVLETAYAYTDNKDIAKAFKNSRNMKYFTYKKMSVNEHQIDVINKSIPASKLKEIELHEKGKKYNKYSYMSLVLTVHESIEVKQLALQKISDLLWYFDGCEEFMALKKKYMFALSDIKYDRITNYEAQDLVSDKVIMGDYINCFIEKYGWSLKR